MAVTLREYLTKLNSIRLQSMRRTKLRDVFYGPSGPLVTKLDGIDEILKDIEFTVTGEMKVIGAETANGVPMTTFDSTSASVNVKTSAIGYEVTQNLLARCERSGFNFSNMAGAANALIAEKFLQTACFLGSTQYGWGSLLTNSSVGTVTLPNKATPGGAITWTSTTTFEEMVQDLLLCAEGVATASYGVWDADTLLMPTNRYQTAARTKHATYPSLNVIEEAKTRMPTLRRVISIKDLEGAGSGGTNRMMAFASNPLVVTMSEKPFSMLKTRETDLGWRVVETLATAGTIWGDIQGAVYADGI